jgi:hypothetical protein
MTGEFLVATVWLFYSVVLSIMVAIGGYFFARCLFEIWSLNDATDEKGEED